MIRSRQRITVTIADTEQSLTIPSTTRQIEVIPLCSLCGLDCHCSVQERQRPEFKVAYKAGVVASNTGRQEYFTATPAAPFSSGRIDAGPGTLYYASKYKGASAFVDIYK